GLAPEREQLGALARQLDRLAEHAANTAPQARARYHFDYARLRADLKRVRTGSQAFLGPRAPSRAIPLRWPVTTCAATNRRSPRHDRRADRRVPGQRRLCALGRVRRGARLRVRGAAVGRVAMRTAYVGWADDRRARTDQGAGTRGE